MSDQAVRNRRLTHTSVMSSDELITLMEENVEDYAIFVTDPERRIINWSKGAERLFGYSVEEVLGKDAALIYTPVDRSQHVPAQEFQTANKMGRAVNERFHIKKDGTVFWGSGILTALREENGRVRGTVKILRDLTERKRFEENLRQETDTAQRERARAEASAREVEQFNFLLSRTMAEAHHRIKNSFQMLAALLEMQMGSEAEEASPDYSKLLLHIHSLATIYDLLTDGIKNANSLGYVRAKTLLDKLAQLMQKTVTGRHIHAEVQEISLPAKQATSIAPLFNEMVTNAIKHGKGDIVITFTLDNDTACLEVCDDGPGFPAGFDPGEAGHMGLELMETLTRHDLRGEIRYENLPAGGARVAVTFPIPNSLE